MTVLRFFYVSFYSNLIEVWPQECFFPLASKGFNPLLKLTKPTTPSQTISTLTDSTLWKSGNARAYELAVGDDKSCISALLKPTFSRAHRHILVWGVYIMNCRACLCWMSLKPNKDSVRLLLESRWFTAPCCWTAFEFSCLLITTVSLKSQRKSHIVSVYYFFLCWFLRPTSLQTFPAFWAFAMFEQALS